jgi:hypothetical protein
LPNATYFLRGAPALFHFSDIHWRGDYSVLFGMPER